MNKEDHHEVPKIAASAKQLADTAHIREQINAAVHQKSYAHSIHSKANAKTKSSHIDLFELFLGGNEVGHNKSSDDEIVGSSKNTTTFSIRQHIEKVLSESLVSLKSPLNEKKSSIVPNNINTTSAEAHVQVNREKLEIISVVEDPTFSLGEKVIEWKTLQMHIGVRHALIGRTTNDLLLVVEVNGTYQLEHELNFPYVISTTATFTKWNGTHAEGIIAVASTNQITFVRVTDDLSKMEMIWKWTMHGTATTMMYFQLLEADTLLIVSDLENGAAAADIYTFELDTLQSWLLQKIPLQYACPSVSILDVHLEYILCFAQNNSVELYHKYHSGTEGFTHTQSILAAQVQNLATFTIGGLSYLTFGGKKPQILRFSRGKFHPQTILPPSWGFVEYMVPIPARTYRDDLILLIQHRIEFEGSHSIPDLQAAAWQGEAFGSAGLSVPCYYGDVKYERGLSCMLDLDRDQGIFGSSIIQRGNRVSLLVPREQAPSGLFHLEFKLVKVGGDDDDDGSVVGDHQNSRVRDVMQEIVNYQNEMVQQTNDALVNSVEFGGEFTEEWQIDWMEVEEIKIEGDFEADEIWFGDKLWTDDDSTEEDIDALCEILIEQLRQINDFIRSLEVDRIGTSEIKHVESPSANGQFNIDKMHILREKRSAEYVDNVKVKHLNVEFINGVPVENYIFIDNDGILDLGNIDVVVNAELEVAEEVQIPTENISTDVAESAPASNIGSLHVTGDMNVDTINGVVWTEFIQQLVMTNTNNAFDHLDVLGVS